MQGQVEARFSQHPDAEIIGSQPGLGPILGARVPGEFGDGPHRHTSDKARKNYAATSPLTRQPGRRQTVIARYVHNDPLRDALDRQASAAPATSAPPRPRPPATPPPRHLPPRPPPPRPAPRPRRRPQRGTAPARPPARRHLARLPEKPAPPTTRRPPGPGTPSKKPSPRPDIQAPG